MKFTKQQVVAEHLPETVLPQSMEDFSFAPSNIALCKYWGSGMQS
ncbi:hypothetical protein [Aliamphritea spongicola]|nr:hypothetical protein [Aliamphritea spongicola]